LAVDESAALVGDVGCKDADPADRMFVASRGRSSPNAMSEGRRMGRR
jgi:hypothetical protein